MIRYAIGDSVWHGSVKVIVVGYVGQGIAPNADGTITLPPTFSEIVTPTAYLCRYPRIKKIGRLHPDSLSRLAPAPWTVSRRTA